MIVDFTAATFLPPEVTLGKNTLWYLADDWGENRTSTKSKSHQPTVPLHGLQGKTDVRSRTL